MKPLRLAVDTNVLLDLAEGVESVLDAFAILEQRLPDHDLYVLPSVLDELAYLCDSAASESVRRMALAALKLIREQERFRPLLEVPFSQALIEQVAQEVRSQGLLPPEEVHDSLILAEAALLGCGLLLSSDEHLRGVDHEHLTLLLNPFDLVPPVVSTPREIVQKFFR